MKGVLLYSQRRQRDLMLSSFLGKPVILHQIEMLEKAEADEILIAMNEYETKYISYIVDEHESVKVVSLDDIYGSAGALREVFRINSVESYVCFDGAVISDIDLKGLVGFHNARQGEAWQKKEETVLGSIVVIRPSAERVMTAYASDRKIMRMERETKFYDYYLDGGIYLINPYIYDHLPERGELFEDVFMKIKKQLRLYYHEGKYKRIRSQQDVLEGW